MRDANLLTIIMDGADEHHGHVMARALADKLTKFLNVFGSYERARLSARTRQTDFEVVHLSHNSPTELGLRPVTRVPSYHPSPIVEWTLSQWAKISDGVRPDEDVDEGLLGDVADLAKPPEASAFASFRIAYGEHSIRFDERAYLNAERLRIAARAERPELPWRAGHSYGTITGELRSVLDTNSERQIVIVPPVGPSHILCRFTDTMRESVRDNLWHNVRLSGILHYDGKSATPYLMDVETIQTITVPKDRIHLADRVGLFKGSLYEGSVTGGFNV